MAKVWQYHHFSANCDSSDGKLYQTVGWSAENETGGNPLVFIAYDMSTFNEVFRVGLESLDIAPGVKEAEAKGLVA